MRHWARSLLRLRLRVRLWWRRRLCHGSHGGGVARTCSLAGSGSTAGPELERAGWSSSARGGSCLDAIRTACSDWLGRCRSERCAGRLGDARPPRACDPESLPGRPEDRERSCCEGRGRRQGHRRMQQQTNHGRGSALAEQPPPVILAEQPPFVLSQSLVLGHPPVIRPWLHDAADAEGACGRRREPAAVRPGWSPTRAVTQSYARLRHVTEAGLSRTGWSEFVRLNQACIDF